MTVTHILHYRLINDAGSLHNCWFKSIPHGKMLAMGAVHIAATVLVWRRDETERQT